ncbi:MAG TPA: SPASM domain-containing protein [Bacillota bacterium]|nr:SPASM domain-containing protein [Bacillota bacterium]
MSEISVKKNNPRSKKQLKFLYLSLTKQSKSACLSCCDLDSQSQEHSMELSLPILENLVSDCVKLGVEMVCFTGPDPFQHQNWIEIARLFRNQGIKISVSANGAVITEEIARSMKELETSAQISLDDEETQNFTSKVEPSSAKELGSRALEGVQLLMKHGIPLNLNSVISKTNIHRVDYWLQVSIKLDITITFTLYNGILHSDDCQLQPLTIEETAQFIKQIAKGYETNPRISVNLPPLLVPSNMKPAVNPGCGWTHHVGGVLWNGDVTICPFASSCPELIAGNIRNQSFYDIWNDSPVLNNLRNNSYNDLKGICKYCPVCDLCMGACRLDSYLRFKDPTASFHLCQAFYDAMLKGSIPDKEFPSKMLEVLV